MRRVWLVSWVLLVCAMTVSSAVASPTLADVQLGPKATAPSPGQALGAPTPGGRWVTFLFGRTQWVATDTKCRPLPGAVPLDRVAAELAARGKSATAAVVIDRTNETTRQCYGGYTLHASWTDLATLRDVNGWAAISDGITHGDMTKMTPAQQQQESCGSLVPLQGHGHDRAWGLFAYGNNKATNQIQADVVSKCFAYGRRYVNDSVNVGARMAAPWFQKTNSVLGGKCNDPSLPCFSMSVPNDRRYWVPSRLAALVAPGDDRWSVLQFYRLVEGTQTSDPHFRWDCSSGDPARHWTNNGELYCFSDFLAAVDAVPPGVTVTDPATVAQAWGRVPG